MTQRKRQHDADGGRREVRLHDTPYFTGSTPTPGLRRRTRPGRTPPRLRAGRGAGCPATNTYATMPYTRPLAPMCTESRPNSHTSRPGPR